jgi:Uma2 family endonuclease
MPVDTAYFDMAPDWVCEALSPSTASLDRGDKRRVYGEYGVKHIWFVDPEAQTLEILELENGRYHIVEVYSGDALIRAVPFDAIELELGALWMR